MHTRIQNCISFLFEKTTRGVSCLSGTQNVSFVLTAEVVDFAVPTMVRLSIKELPWLRVAKVFKVDGNMAKKLRRESCFLCLLPSPERRRRILYSTGTYV